MVEQAAVALRRRISSMGGWIIFDDKRNRTIEIPWEVEFPKSPHREQLPDEVHLSFDERRFKRNFGDHALWVSGKGEYAVLAYCGDALTITRWPTLEEAVAAKRRIDGTGCGGRCVGVHLIMRFDATNPEHAAEQAVIEDYAATHPEAVSFWKKKG
jgi:hypothetical protein